MHSNIINSNKTDLLDFNLMKTWAVEDFYHQSKVQPEKKTKVL